MKNRASWFMTILVIVLVFALLRFGLPDRPASAAAATGTPQAASATSSPSACDSRRSIQVTGTAVVNVAPDRALVQLGVQSNATTVRAVEQSNSTATQAVIKAVRSLGIDAQDIATDWYVIEPIYEDYDSLYIKGYRISNMVAITVRDVSQASRVIAAALQTGANQVINVEFYTSDLRKYRDQARDMAMKAAREKAQALGQTAGAEIDCILTVNENSWSSYNGWWPGRGQSQNLWTQNAVQNVAPSSGPSASTGDEPISLGKISVRADVSAVFSLK